MLLYLIFGLAFAQQQDLCPAGQQNRACLEETEYEVIKYDDQGEIESREPVREWVVSAEIQALYSDKFRCFLDSAGAYDDWSEVFYGTTMSADPCCKTAEGAPRACNPTTGEPTNNQCQRTTRQYFYCCGYMANGRRQCDRIQEWKKVGDSSFTLCETDYRTAVSEQTNSGGPKLRRDLCCENDEFNDCNLCKSFVVWDFTVDEDSHGGDITMEKEYQNNKDPGTGALKYGYDDETKTVIHPDQEAMKDSTNTAAGKVFLQNDWRDLYYGQQKRTVQHSNGETVDYPEYAYDNLIHPAGFARATLREFNDPPVCVYVPNVGGRVIEVRVEPEESGSQVCVDDLHEDSLERNAPGVTQACDDSRLQTCFPDANTSEDASGFAFLISCAESCADSDLDLWFRVRASINRWVDNGKVLQDNNGEPIGAVAPGSDQTEVATEMWCMWGNADMRDENGVSTLTDIEDFPGKDILDGNFAKWDIYASDLAPPEEPQVQPIPDNALALSVGILLSMVALLF